MKPPKKQHHHEKKLLLLFSRRNSATMYAHEFVIGLGVINLRLLFF